MRLNQSKFALYCTSIFWSTEILVSKLSIHGKLNIQSTLITQTPFTLTQTVFRVASVFKLLKVLL